MSSSDDDLMHSLLYVERDHPNAGGLGLESWHLARMQLACVQHDLRSSGTPKRLPPVCAHQLGRCAHPFRRSHAHRARAGPYTFNRQRPVCRCQGTAMASEEQMMWLDEEEDADAVSNQPAVPGQASELGASAAQQEAESVIAQLQAELQRSKKELQDVRKDLAAKVRCRRVYVRGRKISKRAAEQNLSVQCEQEPLATLLAALAVQIPVQAHRAAALTLLALCMVWGLQTVQLSRKEVAVAHEKVAELAASVTGEKDRHLQQLAVQVEQLEVTLATKEEVWGGRLQECVHARGAWTACICTLDPLGGGWRHARELGPMRQGICRQHRAS